MIMLEAICGNAAPVGRAAGVVTRCVALGYLFASSPDLFAQTELSWSAGAGISHSNNINREETDEVSENTLRFEGSVEWQRRSDRLDADVEARVSIDEFTNNTFSTEVRGIVAAELDFRLIGNSLFWQLQETFGQLRIDNLAPDTPANRENVNILRTGPIFTQRLGGRSTLSAQAYYERSSFEESAEDGDTVGGGITLERRLGPRSLASINALARRVEFDERQLFSSFDAQEVYLAFDREGAQTRLRIESGYSAIHDAGQTDDGVLFRLQANRRIAPRGTLMLNARSEFTTTADAFRYEQTSSRPGLVTRPLEASANPFKLDSVELSYDLAGRRLQAEFALQFERERFERSRAEDRHRKGARLTLGGQLGPVWSAEVGIDYSEESLRDTARDFKDFLVEASLSRRFSPNVGVRLGVTHLDRSAGDRTLEFEELIVQLAVTYQNQSVRRREGGPVSR